MSTHTYVSTQSYVYKNSCVHSQIHRTDSSFRNLKKKVFEWQPIKVTKIDFCARFLIPNVFVFVEEVDFSGRQDLN